MKLSLVFGSVIKLFNVQFRKLYKNEKKKKTVDKFFGNEILYIKLHLFNILHSKLLFYARNKSIILTLSRIVHK